MSQQSTHNPDQASHSVQLNEAETALLDMFADFLRERARARTDEHTSSPLTQPANFSGSSNDAQSRSDAPLDAHIHATAASHATASRESIKSTQSLASQLNMLNLYLESPSGYPTGSISHALTRPPASSPFRTPSGSLSRREVEVLQLIEEGLTNREIAQRIVVEQGTVKRHVHNILSKLNARNRAEAVAKARNPIGL